MRMVRWFQVSLLIVGLPLLMGQACPLFPGSQEPSDTELTEDEAAAIQAIVQASAGLSQAVGIAQTPPDPDDDGPGHETGEVTQGECPAITLTGLPFSQGLAFQITIDFGGTPCSPDTFPGLSCSGSASGFFSRVARTISLTFDDIACENSLSGQVHAAYDFSSTGVNLNGAFDLSYTVDGQVVDIDGQSSLIGYDRVNHRTTIGTFEGAISSGDVSYAVDLNDVKLSYEDNANLIPSAGVVELSGSTIRQLTIRFDADSPDTGVAEVSINNGPFFEVNLLEL